MKKNILLFISLLLAASVWARPGTVKTYAPTALSTSSALVLSANKERKGLIISNRGTDPALIKFGSLHSDGLQGIKLAAGSIIDFVTVPMDSVYIRTAASTGVNAVDVIEFE